MSNLNFEELERIAYITGDIKNAGYLAECDDYTLHLDGLDDLIDSAVEKAIEKQCPNYAEYKAFFYECFERLNGHYPCPSITSDYDQSVIFNAIDKGEGVSE